MESTTSIYSGLLRLNDLAIAQPNNRIDLVVVAQRDRRQQVYNQLCRPFFRRLAPKCGFVSAEDVKEQLQRLKALNLSQRARVTGLLDIEHFQFSDDAYYSNDV